MNEFQNIFHDDIMKEFNKNVLEFIKEGKSEFEYDYLQRCISGAIGYLNALRKYEKNKMIEEEK